MRAADPSLSHPCRMIHPMSFRSSNYSRDAPGVTPGQIAPSSLSFTSKSEPSPLLCEIATTRCTVE